MTEKQKIFAEYYAADPNATEAAKAAGYSEKTARSQGQRLLTDVDIIKYIRELQERVAEIRISTIAQVKAFWSDIINDPSEKTADRLKASELLAKSAGVFTHTIKGKDKFIISSEQGDGEDVVIYLPEIEGEKSCAVNSEDEK